MVNARLIVAVALLSVSPLVTTEAYAYSNFATARETSSRDLSPFSKWNTVLQRYSKELKEPNTSEQWQAMLDSAKGSDFSDKLDSVNSFFNKITYVEDRDNWGKSDYWATPFEMMGKQAGDCEDYAIAKYLSLKKLGVSESSMRIMIVEDTNLNVMHAILEVRSGDKRYLLDNQISRVVDEANVNHYRPIYAINGQQWWAYK